ncbi:hypothetical protein BP00DRAFT_92073 [Aspergillus indologenus CBS 114.80]|uniref:Uncharacterized protein n=1 Tax=Aspergillus indologenus CBS 114.80 TaxID=1450541 RepID=A0A2V5IDA6_9EURO|nr:hypothetical protein BP00DRAFT_92073 [Aspergillus indologenus CBS 114.80]
MITFPACFGPSWTVTPRPETQACPRVSRTMKLFPFFLPFLSSVPDFGMTFVLSFSSRDTLRFSSFFFPLDGLSSRIMAQVLMKMNLTFLILYAAAAYLDLRNLVQGLGLGASTERCH